MSQLQKFRSSLGSTGNVIAAIASFFIPGLGQLAQGRWVAAVLHFSCSFVFWFF
jgi:TM2 domain-containing membrane protein YozV